LANTLIIRRDGKPVVLDGQSLTIAGVVGVARYGTSVALDDAPEIRERMAKSRNVLVGKVQAAKSVYGVSTGLGGSGTRHALVFRATFSRAPFTPPKSLSRFIYLIRLENLACRPNGLQRTRGRMTRSVSGLPSCNTTTRAS
jgi:hypothetical protein